MKREEKMMKIMGIILAWVLLLLLALPITIQAATLTLLDGVFRVDAYDNYSGTHAINSGFPSPAGTSVTSSYGGYANASASGSVTSSGLQFTFLAQGYEGSLWSGASTYANNPTIPWDFIFFRVDSSPDDTTKYGKLNYFYSWNCSSMHGTADSLLSIKINTEDKLVGILIHGAGSSSEAFDVAIGDIIGIKAEAGGDIDGIGYYFSGCSVSLVLDGFNPVPLPHTLLLLGSGLLGIVAYGMRNRNR